MSVRAELLRLALRLLKKWHSRKYAPIATARRRLKRIEAFVPRPPEGTQTTAIDAGGVNAVRVAVRQARSDRCVLYFHGGAYAIGTAKLLRDFTWRIGAAARAHVLYFDYRLAPEHPFPAALEDAVAAYRWLAGRFDPRRIAFMGDSAGGGLALATLYKLRDEGIALPAAAVAVSPWTDLALTGPSLRANAAADPMLNVANLPTLANDYLGGADPDSRRQRRDPARRFDANGREIESGGMRRGNRSVATHAARVAPVCAHHTGGPSRAGADRHVSAAKALTLTAGMAG